MPPIRMLQGLLELGHLFFRGGGPFDRVARLGVCLAFLFRGKLWIRRIWFRHTREIIPDPLFCHC